MTIVEGLGIFLYYELLEDDIDGELSIVFFVLMALALVPATWFQFTLIKWCIFVRKYVRLRERRVR